eukprot:gnl/Dysnectes_brevis/157_a184_2754.p1 GENE.gnl/Dysnectes_brevis/157_a184_2754~~gnl/Dysnectes_brevis/157_a184_2754.p1  ORF type:complete len:431 (-),score=73.54 gnl/Dysnectes_brevis/157_a184_2754:1159-2451(-)
METSQLVNVTMPLIGYLAIGVIVSKMKTKDKKSLMLNEKSITTLNTIVVRVGMPLAIFKAIATTETIDYKFFLLFVVFILIAISIILTVLGLLHVLNVSKFSAKDFAHWTIQATFPNAFIIGVPVITALYGETAGLLYPSLIVLGTSAVGFPLWIFLFEVDRSLRQHEGDLDKAGEKRDIIDDHEISTSVEAHHYTVSHPGQQNQEGCGEEAIPHITRTETQIISSVSPSQSLNDLEAAISIHANPQHPLSVVSSTVQEVKHITPKPSTRLSLVFVSVFLSSVSQPCVVAMGLAFVWRLCRFGSMPSPLDNLLSWGSALPTPLGMISTGIFAGRHGMAALKAPRGWVTLAVRVVGGAAVGILACLIMDIRDEPGRIAVLILAAPSAVVSFALAEEYDVYSEDTASALILSLLLIPVNYFLLIKLVYWIGI